MKDISSMSYTELLDLEKQIKVIKQQILDNEIMRKDKLDPHVPWDLAKKRFPECFDDDGYFKLRSLADTYHSRIDRSIFELCNLITGNYEIRGDKIFACGVTIYHNPKQYENLYNGLIATIKKYEEECIIPSRDWRIKDSEAKYWEGGKDANND